MNDEVRWRKSSFSGGDNCVEVAPTLTAIRDSKNPTGPVLTLPEGAVTEFVRALKAGDL